MPNIDSTYAALLVITCLHGAIALVVIYTVWRAARDRASERHELSALVQKIELLTAPTRERIVGQYDGMLADLIERIPEEVSRETGEKIFDTESRIITRLAELEPDLKRDRIGREKMNELIESMESLESSVAAIAAETVQTALRGVRARLLEETKSPTVRETKS